MGFGHHKSQCPSKFVGITYKIHSQDDSEWEEPTDKMISECERKLTNEAKERAAKGFIGLMHPMFTIHRMCPVPIKPKQKRSTFSWQLTLHNGSEILGPPPQLNKVDFSKRGEIDEVAL